MRLKSYTNNSRNAIDPSRHPALVDQHDEYLANLWQLVGLLREAAGLAYRCAGHSPSRVMRGRLFEIERGIDARLRGVLQELGPSPAGIHPPRLAGGGR